MEHSAANTSAGQGRPTERVLSAPLSCSVVTLTEGSYHRKVATTDARLFFRTMRLDEAGEPMCGPGAAKLGVRIPKDIAPDEAGLVHPRTGGLSVTPDDPARLPAEFRPESLGGTSRFPLFSIASSALPEALSLTPDARSPRTHWFVEPARSMRSEEFQAILCGTRPNWRRI